MPRINTFKKLVISESGLVLTILGIFSIPRLGVAEIAFGAEVANNLIYPKLDAIIQGVALLAIFVLLAIGVMAFVEYIRLRGKPDKRSLELIAINELATDLSELRAELRDNRNDNSRE